jgi:short-subunit dehydrogenase
VKIALVTGASFGLGEALCQELLKQDFFVIGIARSKEKLYSLTHHNYLPMVCDVSDEKAVSTVSHELQQKGLTPNLFFLNAAPTGEEAVEPGQKLDLERHRLMMSVIYFGVLSWIACWEERCKANGGATFVVTNSVNAYFAPPQVIAYSAAKAAIAKAFEGLSITYQPSNLHFSIVYCGPINTQGLKTPRKLPFTQEPSSVAKYMIKCALKKKERCNPSFFYTFVTKFLHSLPSSWSAKILSYLSTC